MDTNEFELQKEAVCLALLTFWGIKPLSRIEYPIESWILGIFQKLGLKIATVEQKVGKRKKVSYKIISMDPSLIEEFKSIFEGELISLSESTRKILGLFFGTPKCCLNADLKGLPNSLSEEDQGILFHWACPGCKKTRKLIPIYREAWDRVRKFFKKRDINLLIAPYVKA